MSRSYKRIRRDKERHFPHQVRLTHARLWRMDHVDAQLRQLQPGQWAWWHEGDELRGDDVGIWGFKCPVQAAVLQDWSTLAVLIGVSRRNSRLIDRRGRVRTGGESTGQSR